MLESHEIPPPPFAKGGNGGFVNAYIIPHKTGPNKSRIPNAKIPGFFAWFIYILSIRVCQEARREDLEFSSLLGFICGERVKAKTRCDRCG
jgi:hypothetical protein